MASRRARPVKLSESIEVADGMVPASPIATAMRQTNSDRKPPARPQSAVARLKTSTLPTMIRLRLVRSASRASGKPAKT